MGPLLPLLVTLAEPELHGGAAAVAPPAAEAQEDAVERRRPGEQPELPAPIRQDNPGAISAPPPQAFPHDHIPVPDRWRLIEAVGVKEKLWDPYHQNTLKGDRPLKGSEHLFVALNAISDTVIEPRSFPIPVGNQTTSRPGSNDVFGRSDSLVVAQTFIVGAALISGSTAFMPPHYELRLTLAANYNRVSVDERRVLFVEPSKGTVRNDGFLGVQEAFFDYHLRNTSDRFDFDSIRIGIQPITTDFRGFLFQDNQLGIRLFGNRDNNRFQYNLAAFQRIEKDTNSGLNDVAQDVRKDWVFIANLYRQDLPVPGLTSQITVVHNRNREGGEIYVDHNGFPQRPALLGDLRGRDYDVTYLGYSADGHFSRINLSLSAYGAFGKDKNSIFTGKPAKIRAFFVAAEPSIDLSWVRLRGSALYATGDGDPYDDTEGGFDAIFENPQFAGADTSYWIRQTIPFAGGGRAIGVNGRNGILNSLRASKEEGQSNFNNPGTMLLGVGADFDITPEVRLTTNVNHLWFENTSVIKVLRMEGTIPREIGWDASLSAIYRPRMNQNLVFRASAAVFDPGKGFGDLFAKTSGGQRFISVLFNATLSY